MTTIAIILALAVILAILFLRGKTRGEGLVQREVIDEKEYLAQLRAEAKHMRCPHPAYQGQGRTCGRAANRPCYGNCQGRRNLSTSWHG